MSTIKISDISPVGYDLFSDSESYMMALSEDEFSDIGGAGSPSALTIVTTWACIGGAALVAVSGLAASYAVGRWG
ncbi:hypothetical protein NIES2119_00655 [[Phormidium ambiguum] IAM M-71]|uniref:Bacteriocin n=1 Tax=[Phormidium ambiguum] IAM M-71 TaxID=454136 RepID=A0A1U7ITK4_9CYAN|nr:hypothetical protein [Phormidium ambiguum]OKH40857.1 hypothetical protein NIES2119_00655 [Phormidium ambiguum IAM M-71]